MKKFKVIIAGGRQFNDYQLLKLYCNKYLNKKSKTHKIIIVSGKANGADKLGEDYAKEKGYSIKPFPAEWNDSTGAFIRSAGYKRNVKMANYADAAILFWNGNTKNSGTNHMIDISKLYRLSHRVIKCVY